jgi:hypothetical protein
MLRFRLILAWLLLAALPLQGWAAATMLFCGPAQRDAVVAKAHSPGQAISHHHMDPANHDMQAAHGQHQADTTGDIGNGHHGAKTVADGSHTCGVCASCCNGVALAQTQHSPSIAVAPRADLAEPLTVVLARPSPVPDKPPRA